MDRLLLFVRELVQFLDSKLQFVEILNYLQKVPITKIFKQILWLILNKNGRFGKEYDAFLDRLMLFLWELIQFLGLQLKFVEFLNVSSDNDSISK